MHLRALAFTFAAVLCNAAHVVDEIPGGTPDGTLATFTLAQPAIASSVAVYANGIRNARGLDYAVVSNSIVFQPLSIPQKGWTLRVDYDVQPPPVTVSIDAGGPGDQYFAPASSCSGSGTCPFKDPAMGAPPYDTLRYGYSMAAFNYQIPVPNGRCDLTLGFSEPNKTAAGQRVFTITANDQVVADVDIFARAGAAKTIVTIPITGVVVSSGMLRIGFTPTPGTWNAIISSIVAVCQPNS